MRSDCSCSDDRMRRQHRHHKCKPWFCNCFWVQRSKDQCSSSGSNRWWSRPEDPDQSEAKSKWSRSGQSCAGRQHRLQGNKRRRSFWRRYRRRTGSDSWFRIYDRRFWRRSGRSKEGWDKDLGFNFPGKLQRRVFSRTGSCIWSNCKCCKRKAGCSIRWCICTENFWLPDCRWV